MTFFIKPKAEQADEYDNGHDGLIKAKFANRLDIGFIVNDHEYDIHHRKTHIHHI